MKKLAMALLCLVSVAFFASCSKEGQPSISVLNEDGYVQDGAIVTLDEDINFGFVMTSSPDSGKELTKLVVKIDGVQWAEINLTGMKEYTYRETISYGDSKEIIGESVITATVTDKAGEEATASITLYFNEEEILVPVDFTWIRHGSNPATGLAELGLQWTSNEREIYAVITPLEGAAFYKFGAGRDIWNSTTTLAEKITLFQENLEPITEFKEISCTAADKDYDIVLGTVYNNQVNLIHITHSSAVYDGATKVTITGQYK